MFRFDQCLEFVVFPGPRFETIEEHAVDLHALIADSVFVEGGNQIGSLIVITPPCRWWNSQSLSAFLLAGAGQLQYLVVIELLLEVFTVGEEIEQLETGLVPLTDLCFQYRVGDLLSEIVSAGAAPLDLHEVLGEKMGRMRARFRMSRQS